MNAAERRKLLRDADRILVAANDNKSAGREALFRGGRPAWNWLAKNNQHGAACLWLIARPRLPQPVNDNHIETAGMGLDRRKDGKARGKDRPPRNAESYLALPGIRPRLGDAPPEPAPEPWWRGLADRYDEEPRITLKQQRDCFDFQPDCRFGFCAPAVAEGAFFIGAQGGLGQPKLGKSRGDIRRVAEPSWPTPPDEIDTVIEAVLARATVAGVGEALGARGGYADRRGAKALTAAARWAVQVVEGAKLRHATPNGVKAAA